MVYLGDYKKNDVVYYVWNTTGVSGWTSINPSTSGVVGVYKNTTAAMSVGDVVYNVGFDGLAGLNDITVPTSGAFFVVASDYYIVVSGAVIDGETVNAALCSFSLENRFVTANTIDTISGNLTTMQTNIDTVSGNLLVTDSTLITVSGNLLDLDGDVYALSGIVVEFSGGISTPDFIAAHVADYVVTSGVAAGFDDVTDITTLSATVDTVSGNILRTENILTTVSGNLLDLDSDIVVSAAVLNTVSGNLLRVEDTLNTASGDLMYLDSVVDVISGNLNTGVSVNISGIAPEALTQIVTSGNAADWGQDVDGVMVSGITPAALTEIVASGNDAGWNDIAIDTTLGDIISGVWSQNLDNGDFATSGYAGQKMKNVHTLLLGAAQIESSGTAQYMRIYNNDSATGTPVLEFQLYNQSNADPTISPTAITGRKRVSE